MERRGVYIGKNKSCPCATHGIGGWVDPRAGLNDVEKRKFLILQGLKLRPLGRPARTSRYIDCAIPAHMHIEFSWKSQKERDH
jgi:hypothetical protein